ncbi:MAG: metallophosphoesterase [Candidatus Gastranaerophilales bacterium]|nr:metallophosphoesterase [Candidatus Gastranaerophilales bacterium]
MHRIKLSLIAFCIALMGMQSSVNAEVLEFAQVGDVHYTLENSVLDKYLYFLSLSLKKKNPEFVVFLGDNVDRSKEEDVIGFMRDIHPIRHPYYLVLGDKDAHRLSGIEKKVYLDIVSTFNKHQDNKNTYFYFKPNSDFICVVLDDTSEFAQSNHGEIPDEQVEWLDNLLTKNPKKLFIIFQHSPLVPPRDEYKLTMINTEKYEAVLKKHSNIVMISSGHYHQESVQTDDNGVRHVCAPAFKDIPHSYQLIRIIYDENSYKSPKDVEITVTKIKV